jgi:hypothetical protein
LLAIHSLFIIMLLCPAAWVIVWWTNNFLSCGVWFELCRSFAYTEVLQELPMANLPVELLLLYCRPCLQKQSGGLSDSGFLCSCKVYPDFRPLFCWFLVRLCLDQSQSIPVVGWIGLFQAGPNGNGVLCQKAIYFVACDLFGCQTNLALALVRKNRYLLIMASGSPFCALWCYT